LAGPQAPESCSQLISEILERFVTTRRRIEGDARDAAPKVGIDGASGPSFLPGHSPE
jgi:hypothetical protein